MRIKMPLFLRKRDTESTELMDRPDCNPQLLSNTYRYFRQINRFLSGWDVVFHEYILPYVQQHGYQKTYKLLDIGYGGGDIPIMLKKLAASQDIRLQITAIDTDPRALEYVQQLPESLTKGITFRCTDEQQLLDEAQAGTYDFVVSNHLVHHLEGDTLRNLLRRSADLCRGYVLFNDLCRSDIAWTLFNGLTLFAFRDSFIRPDGLLSIRRSYTPDELHDILPAGYEVRPLHPFRNLILNKTD
jgi:2-polyprenyl-3-methyl-5-hydroxy-6-metoxy-1,4-benzoquinol methylase